MKIKSIVTKNLEYYDFRVGRWFERCSLTFYNKFVSNLLCQIIVLCEFSLLNKNCVVMVTNFFKNRKYLQPVTY